MGKRLLRDGAGNTMDATLAIKIQARKGGETAGASFNERILNIQGTLGTGTNFSPAFLLEGDLVLILLHGHIYITIWETIPPTANATIHVPIQMISPSLKPRSFIITMSEAMQGTNRVMTIRATVICIGLRDI